MYFSNPALVLTAAMGMLVPVAAFDLWLCYDRDLRGGCAIKAPMPVNGCYSNRGGTNWSGFSNDAVSSIRITGNARCRFYADADCQGGPMFEEGEGTLNSIYDKYRNFNDALSSVYCWTV